MVADVPTLDGSASEPKENHLRKLVTVATRHWLMIVLFTAAGLLGGTVVQLLVQDKAPKWKASVDLLVKSSPLETLYKEGLVTGVDTRKILAALGEEAFAEDIARALVRKDIAEGGPWAGLTTESEIRAAIDEIRMAVPKPEELPGQGKIRILAHAGTKEEAVRRAECAARVFVERSQQYLLEEEEKNYKYIQGEREDLLRRFEEAEKKHWEYVEKLGFRTSGPVSQLMSDLKKDHEVTEAKKREIEEKIRAINAKLKKIGEDLPTALGQMDVVSELVNQLKQLEVEKSILLVEYEENSEEVQTKQAEISDVTQAILARVGEQGELGGTSGDVLSDRGSLFKERTRLELELVGAEERVKDINRQLEETLKNLSVRANENYELEQLTRDAQQYRQQLDLLLAEEFKFRPHKTDELSQLARRDPIYAAPLDSRRGPMQIFVSVLVCGVAGLLFGLMCALLFESFDTSIHSAEDVAEYIGIEVLGTIPEMKFGRRPARRRGAHMTLTDDEYIDACIVTQYDPKSPVSEAYRALRTNLQFATIQKKPKTVMVTSAVPGEGKTTTAVNLAVTMADQGMRVLLIDTDLRRPNVHRFLKMDRGPGLADVLRANIDYKSILRPTRTENLWIVSSGHVPPNPSELIGSDRMKRFIAQAGQDFDLVICDAPSILVVTDPVLLSSHLDSVLLVISVENASRETILRAKKLLDAAHAEVAGAVLNGLKATRRHYYYYYYYYEDAQAGGWRRWYYQR